MSRSWKVIFLWTFFYFPLIVCSQNNEQQNALRNIISALQEKYNYQFVFANDIIDGIEINNIPAGLTFQETVEYLEMETGLGFRFLENNFIALFKKESSFYICGYIYDSDTELPLENATINTTNAYTTSDSSGYFNLKVAKINAAITIRYLGYDALTLGAARFKGNENCLKLFMQPLSYSISEITLTDFISKGINKMSDGSFAINFSNFGILPGLIETDVLHTIQALPGIQSINETVSNINIRGGTNDQNLLLWDGIRMYQSGHFFGLISLFNPLITTNVSIIKNGTNAQYTGGVSGIIAMKTNSSVNQKLSGSIGTNFINTDVFVDAPLGKKSSIQLSARKAISNLLETPTYSSYFTRILQNTEVLSMSSEVLNSTREFDFYDTSLRWLYNISNKDRLRVNFINTHDRLVLQENTILDGAEELKESSLKQNSIAGSIYYKRNWSKKFFSTLQLYETDYILKAVNFDIAEQQQLYQENKVSETSIKFDTRYRPDSRFLFLNGYQFTENGTANKTEVDNPKLRQIIQEVIREHSLYSQVSYESDNRKSNVKIGMRYGYIVKFKKHILEPRLNINQQISEHLALNFSGEMKHQNSSQIINFQTDFLGIEKRRWQLANDTTIPVIRSKQLSLGLNYHNKGWLIGAEAYLKGVEGITSQSQGFLNQYIYEKVTGSYNVKGLEILVNKKNKKMSNWLSYTYAINEYTFRDFEEIKFPNNLDIRHIVTFGSSFTAGDLKISGGVNWFTGKPTTRPEQNNEIVDGEINYQAANSSNLNNYLRIDFSTTYQFVINNDITAHLGASVWNSTNRENILYNYFDVSNNLPVEIKQNALGLTPNLTFRVTF